MMSYNSKESLHEWVDKTLDNANNLSSEQIEKLRIIGHEAVHTGAWRGDISMIWRGEIPCLNRTHLDLYV